MPDPETRSLSRRAPADPADRYLPLIAEEAVSRRDETGPDPEYGIRTWSVRADYGAFAIEVRTTYLAAGASLPRPE